MAGSGKSTVGKKIAEHYELRYFSGGDALKTLAIEAGYKPSEQGWWESEEGMNFLKERGRNPTFDKKVDEKLIAWGREGNVVLDSRTMPWLLNSGFKIWLEASPAVRAKRIAARDRLTYKHTLRTLEARDVATKQIYQNLYGFNLGEDFTPFDLILDVNQLSTEEVYETLTLVIDNLVKTQEEKSD